MSEADHSDDLDALQRALGHEFQQPELLAQALTHRSYVNENDDVFTNNQRLEFLGDSVLGLVVADRVYALFPHAEEGSLSSWLASLVNEGALCAIAQSVRLGDYLRLGRGEALGGGRRKPSILADAYEAVIAAIYLDAGLPAAREVILALHADAIAQCHMYAPPEDNKSKFQRLVQAEGEFHPQYAIVDERGPAHERVFVVTVYVGDVEYGEGEGRTRKAAEQDAARVALTRWQLRG